VNKHLAHNHSDNFLAINIYDQISQMKIVKHAVKTHQDIPLPLALPLPPRPLPRPRGEPSAKKETL
jgi:hypothetical protein